MSASSGSCSSEKGNLFSTFKRFTFLLNLARDVESPVDALYDVIDLLTMTFEAVDIREQHGPGKL